MRRQPLERGRAGDLPAVERNTLALAGVNDDALLTVVHAQCERAVALPDELHAEKARAIGRPLVEIGGLDADIAERVDLHSPLSLGSEIYHSSASAVQARSARVVSS